uniref:hypothetical protein 31 n=1 Tax=Moniliophthora perniciosa TaxID=153609 RepID=UPI0000242378|nr:hypothetical protein 31 [Moniliophthora perniciosa]AAQ74321.1 hypothetical protein 31 [Moniliophthora perniciosa]
MLLLPCMLFLSLIRTAEEKAGKHPSLWLRSSGGVRSKTRGKWKEAAGNRRRHRTLICLHFIIPPPFLLPSSVTGGKGKLIFLHS